MPSNKDTLVVLDKVFNLLKNNNQYMKVLVTGGSGLIGKALRSLYPEFIYISGGDCDLRDTKLTDDIIYEIEPTHIIHLAAHVGGVLANTKYVADFYRDNILINTNVLHAAYTNNVQKVVSLMSTCIYPDKVNYPIKESSLHCGPPHDSNFGYAYAKRMLDVQSRAYRQQYGCNFVTLIPNNCFGPHDNFDLENGHVIPAIIRKVYEATCCRDNSITFWGNGKNLRQFTYSIDMARQIYWALINYNDFHPLNIGNPEEVSIRDIVNIVTNYFGYKENIWWNHEHTGQDRKTVDINLRRFGYFPELTPLKMAIEDTCKWFAHNHPNVRGISY